MKPKILFIMHMPPPVHGAAVMGKFIHGSSLINAEYQCSYINLSTASSLSDIGSFSIKKICLILKQYARIVSQLRKDPPDLVYITPNAGGKAFFKEFLIVQKIKRMGFTIVAHFHNKGIEKKQDNPVYDMMFRRFFDGMKVILLSGHLYRDVKKYVSGDNVRICNNGISQSALTGGASNESEQPHLLFLSNLLPAKGVYVMLDALETLKGKGYDFVCDIVGAETADIDRCVLENEITKRHIEDCVRYHGPKYGAEKDDMWSKSSLFVFPSLDECFPLVLLEAMQHSLPIVASEVGGIPDIVKDGRNGYLCESGNAAMLASKAMMMLDDPDKMKEMGKNGYDIYAQKFTKEKFERQFIQVINDFLVNKNVSAEN